jgi:4-diphosphocytidyl-2-C-methyl-D-erythritol kinase
MTTRASIRAQAKLNLWLHVLGREESGYHTIETLFHRIELADDVVVTLAESGERTIVCSEDVGPAADNLAYRAAELYCGETDWSTGFRIDIVKRVPARGGLGGGSADAAATLVALNSMSPRQRNAVELGEMAARLGADVPFLLTDAPAALAWGRGDRMLRLPPLPQKQVALLVPPFGLSTTEVYHSAPSGDPRGAAPLALAMADLTSWAGVARMARNDLGRSLVARSHAALADGIAALRTAGAVMAEMTGSGSVLFGIFDSEPDAAALERATGFPVVLTRTATDVEALRRFD